jgi:hypothetical protein
MPQQLPPVAQPLPAPSTPFDPSNPAGTSPRFLFAGAVALVAKSVGATVVSSLSQGIVNWFNTRTGQMAGPQAAVTPWMAPPPMAGEMAGGYAPGSVPGATPPGWIPPAPAGAGMAGGYPPGTVPGVTPPGWIPPAPAGAGMAGAYPPGAVPPPPPTTFPPTVAAVPGGMPGNAAIGLPPGALQQPGMMSPPNPAVAGAMPAGAAPALYAGIAFEVHLLGPGGSETTVDPGSYIFHSGDRFLVYYRPSLPGRVRVFNVSPVGEVIPIETLTLAGAELAKLGPYQLTEPAGDEALRLVLEPCSTPELVAATRNIVKATDTSSGSGVQISSCQTSSEPATGLATRNIVKATMDGNTGFALDPVNSQELASGRLAPRETSIAIHHR